MRFASLDDPARDCPRAMVGRFRTAPSTRRGVRFAWSGDTAGQGWGHRPSSAAAWRTYATLRGHSPDFFIHSGDTIYADGPIAERTDMPDGGTWNSLVA